MSENKWEQIQPLRIPARWTVGCNKLERIEPEELSPQDERWFFSFTEDILQIYTEISRRRDKKTERQKLTLDLGWYPDGEPTGKFRLVAILDDNWEVPLLEYVSRSKESIVNRLETWMFVEFMPLRFIAEDEFRKNHPCRGMEEQRS